MFKVMSGSAPPYMSSLVIPSALLHQGLKKGTLKSRGKVTIWKQKVLRRSVQLNGTLCQSQS